MLGIVDTAGMSREEGWRADLRLLAHQIKRRAYAPFAVMSEEDFDRSVGELHGQIPGLSDAQIMIGMMKLLRPLGDGHAFINALPDDVKLAGALPVEFYLFTEGVFVTAAGPACQRLLGARVDKIGGHPMAEGMAVQRRRGSSGRAVRRLLRPVVRLHRQPPVSQAGHRCAMERRR